MRPFSPGRRILIEWGFVSLLALLIVTIAVEKGWFVRADNFAYDQYSRQAESPARDDILIIGIDDESTARLGRWPWDRKIHAALLDRLAATKPAAIIYDVLFVDPSANDEALAAAIAKAGPFLPLSMEVPGRNGEAISVIDPVEPIRSAAAGVGHVNLSPDLDGVVRRTNLVEGTAGRAVPHVVTLAACKAHKVACNLPAASAAGVGRIKAGEYLIPFAGGPGHFRTVPFAEVLRGGVPVDVLRDKTIIIGATATGLGDTYATPLGREGVLMSGAEVNASILQGLLNGQQLKIAPRSWQFGIALVPLLLLLGGFLVASPRANLILGVVLGIGLIALTYGLFRFGSIWLAPSTALLALLVIFPLWGWRRLAATSAYMREEMLRFSSDPEVLPLGRSRLGDHVQGDIDLLKRTIAQARELQHFVSDTLKGLPDANLVITPDGKIRFANERAHALLGELKGEQFGIIMERLEGEGLEKLSQTPGPTALPPEIEGKGGRIYSSLWSPIRDAQEEVACWVLRLADITELKIMHRQREEALQLLAHDMRSPQASVIAVLSQGKGKIDPQMASRIEGYARRTLDLADGYVQLARADAKILDLQTIDLRDLMDEAIDDVWPLLKSRGIKIESESAGEEILVLGDHGLLLRAIINLVSNAIQYGPENSVVKCRVKADGKVAKFLVEDRGPGVPADKRKALFRPFQGGWMKGEGIGLGLAIVQSVATRHQGSVGYRFKNGSVFELSLPVA